MSINAQPDGGVNSGNRAAMRPKGSSWPEAGPDGSQAAARLLEMTAHETAQWRAEALREAEAITATARAEGNRLLEAARDEADQLVASARSEAMQAVNDAHAEAQQVREETAAVRQRHDAEVARLERVAAEHRSRLRTHLTEMLDRVDADADETRA